jgi:hypothetical protein
MGDDQQRQFPPMAISDLIVLTLCVSVAFAFNAGDFQDAFKLYVIKWYDILPDLIDVFVTGLCVFGLIVLARQAIRKDRTSIAPGHVLMATIGPFQVFALITGVLRPFFLANEPSVYQAIDYGLCAIVFGLSLIYPIRTVRKLELRWRAVVCFLMLVIGLGLLECVLDAAVNLHLASIFHRRHILAMTGNVDVLMLVAVGVSVAIDLRRRVRRDWLHYLGVLALTLQASAALMHGQRTMARWWKALYDHLVP